MPDQRPRRSAGVPLGSARSRLKRSPGPFPRRRSLPAEHWKHFRTTNPIESTDPTVRHRTTRTKGCLSRQTALAMTHQLMQSAKKKWRKRDGQNRLPEIIEGVESRDGIKHEIKAA